LVGRGGSHTSPHGGCLWLGRFGAYREIPTKLARTLPHVPEGFQFKLGRTLQRVPGITTD
jgi:hypothetical protein